jgi:hypothetical protein
MGPFGSLRYGTVTQGLAVAFEEDCVMMETSLPSSPDLGMWPGNGDEKSTFQRFSHNRQYKKNSRSFAIGISTRSFGARLVGCQSWVRVVTAALPQTPRSFSLHRAQAHK